MKNKIYSILGLAIVLFSACGNDHLADVQKAQHERDSVIAIARANDSSIASYMGYFADIQNTLNNIKNKENALSAKQKGATEFSGTVKDDINRDIQIINDLVEENRRSIADLNKKLANSQYKNGQLNKLIASLNAQLLDKNIELAMLNEDLVDKNNTIIILNNTMSTITAQGVNKTDTINEQRSKLNEAYYIIGNSRSLKEEKVINSEGGFLGLGKEKNLKADFNTGYFTTIDITKTASIPITAKKAKLITNHPSNSYQLKKNDKKQITELAITDPEKFWKVSKYLVVMID
jgi:hypothetical protein